MVFRFSLTDLMACAGGIGIIGSGFSILFIHQRRAKVMKESYYLKALQTLKRNKAAMDLIGEPIQVSKIDFWDTENTCFQTLSTRLKIPFKGIQKSGHLFVFADRDSTEKDWILNRLEIIFNDMNDKKVIVYKTKSKD